MELTKDQIKELELAAMPLIRLLKNYHPHITVMVNSNSAELVEGIAMVHGNFAEKPATSISKSQVLPPPPAKRA